MQPAIAQDGALAISPDNLVTNKAADPDKEAEYILNRQQPPLRLGDGIMNNVARGGKRRAPTQNQRKKHQGPCARIRSAEQERQR